MNDNATLVLVADRAASEKLRHDPSAGDLLLRPDVAVISYPVRQQSPLASLLEQQGLLHPGALLARSPFGSDRFATVEEARERFAVEKHYAFLNLCGLLGARSVRVKQVELETEKGTSTFDASARTPSRASGKLNVEREKLDQFQRRLSLSDELEGGPPDIEAAREFLAQRRLLGDPNMASLLEARQASNRIKSRVVRLSLTDESRTTLAVAARVKIPAYVGLDASYKGTLERKQEYRLTLRVDFE